MCSFASAPAIATLDAIITNTGGSFQGQGASFPPGDSLEVYYKYGKGTTIPSPALLTPKQTVTALYGITPIPGFPVSSPCVDYAYQVSRGES